jgi:hypothetical protein
MHYTKIMFRAPIEEPWEVSGRVSSEINQKVGVMLVDSRWLKQGLMIQPIVDQVHEEMS